MMPPVGRVAQILKIFGIFALFAGTVAAADTTPARARLEWTREPGAEGCIDGEALRKAVDRRWGREVFVDDDTASIVVNGTARRDSRGAWSVKLELHRADGTSLGSRRIVTRASDCSSLDDSVALALGLMLDLSEPTEAPPDQTAPPPPARVSGPPITIPKETIAPRLPWRAEPTVGIEGALGLLPGVSLGARLGIAVEPPHAWRVEIGADLWQNRETTPLLPGARFSMWTIDLAICPLAFDRGNVASWACVAQRAGKITAEGVGFDANAAPDETLLTAEARLGATWAFAPPLAVHAAMGLDVPLVRFRFVYRDEHSDIAAVYRMSPVAGALGLGIGARF